MPAGRVTALGSTLSPAAQGFIAAQGFLAAQGLGLHGLRFPERGAHGLHVGMAHPAIVNDVPTAAPNNNAVTIAALNG